MKHLLFISIFILLSPVFAQKEGIISKEKTAPIYYKTFGEGEPLLIINGGPGFNCNGFEALAKRLASENHCKTILYDQRGTGKSVLTKLDSTTITLELMVEDMERLRKHLKLRKWNIMGHSFGGMLAAAYLSKYPKRVKSVVFSASGGIDLGLLAYVSDSISAKMTAKERADLQAAAKKISEGDTSYTTKLARTTALGSAYLYDKKHLSVIAKRLTEGNPTITDLVWDDLERIKFDCTEKLAKLSTPTLIIQGRDDVIDLPTAQRTQQTLKNSTLILLDNCGHYGWLDAEYSYYQAIRSFLSKK
ncbi:MAG: alpha/beta fold hydrolase [Bacteroidia bacterium]